MGNHSRFRHAAIAYLIYGWLYEGFAVYSVWAHGLAPGLIPKFAAPFLVLGAVMAIGFPLLLLRGYRWFARILSILVGLRTVALGGILLGIDLHNHGGEPFFIKQMSSPTVYGLSLLVTLATLWFVSVAAWRNPPRQSL